MKKTLIALAVFAFASGTAFAANEGSWEYKNGAWKCSGGSFCAGNPGGSGGTGGTGGTGGSGGTVRNSGNSTIAEGAVQNTVAGEQAMNGNFAGNTITTTVDMADNGNTVAAAKLAADAQVEAARIAAEADAAQGGTRDITESREAALNREAAIEIARIQQTVKNTPSVSGPPLVSSNDTCMGSTSGSANAPGIGIGFGTTWTESNCVMLKNSRELWNMGMKAASLALMCNDSKNKEALETTGFECPQTTKAKQAAAATPAAKLAAMPSVNGYTGTDPIVRARMASN